jgi:hypothetical protein
MGPTSLKRATVFRKGNDPSFRSPNLGTPPGRFSEGTGCGSSVSPLGSGHHPHEARAASGNTHRHRLTAVSARFRLNVAMRRSCRSRPGRNRSETSKPLLGLKIAQTPIGQANRLAVPRDIEFLVGRTRDLECVGSLVSHFESPIRFRRRGFIRQ